MPKYTDFELDLQNENSANVEARIRSFLNCNEELTIRPCRTDYFICEPETILEHRI